MSTATILGIEYIVRNRLLTFTPATDSPLATLLGATSTGSGSDGKFFFGQAPDNVTGFWAIERIIDMMPQGMDGGYMVPITFEVIFYGRPRRVAASVSRMATVALEAWHNWHYLEPGGTIRSTRETTGPIPIPYQEPADRELVAVRVTLPARCTPKYLSQYAAA